MKSNLLGILSNRLLTFQPRSAPKMSTKKIGDGESILTMPPEIQAMFADNLEEKSDFQSLRLTSKALCAAAFRQFARYFEHRRHIVSPHSLNALIEITSHPQFGPVVKTISLGKAAVSKTSVTDIAVGGRDFAYNPTEAAIDAFAFVRNHLQWEVFVNSTQPLVLLCHALRNIRNHGTELVLGLFDDDLRSGYGSDQYYTPLRTDWDSPRRNEEGTGVMDTRRSGEVLELLFAAAERVNCPVKGLHFVAEILHQWDGYPSRMLEEGLASALENTILTNNSRLKAGLSLDISLGYPNQPHAHTARCADGALELTDMGLYLGTKRGTIDEPCLSSMASAIQQGAYHSIVLRGCLFQPAKLETFLSRSQQTLDSLHIHSLLLSADDSDPRRDELEDVLSYWVKMLHYLKSTFSLRNLLIEFPLGYNGLEGLFDYDGLGGFLGDLYDTQHNATGKEEVDTLLEDLIWSFRKLIASRGF